MLLSTLIKTLRQAQKDFGDQPILMVDPESGDFEHAQQVYKTHPRAYGQPIDRSKPVCGIVISSHTNNAPDLVLK